MLVTYEADELNRTRWHELTAAGKPFKVRGLDLLPPNLWTQEYLSSVPVKEDVRVTEREDPPSSIDRSSMMRWSEAVSAIYEPRKPGSGSLYIQQAQAPEQLAADIRIPSFFPHFQNWGKGTLNLWISQAGPLGSSTVPHFDGFDNLLCIVSGTKYIKLYPPAQLPSIFEGKHWQPPSLNAFAQTEKQSNNYSHLHHVAEHFDSESRQPFWEGEVVAGEALCIPSLWLHCVTSQPGLCVAINFWIKTMLGFAGDDSPLPPVVESLTRWIQGAPSVEIACLRCTIVRMEMERIRKTYNIANDLFYAE